MKFFRSKGYRIASGFIYGWGASCVIIGALFKIMHLPGAGWVLTIGMVVEAFIFFFSAFEPVMEHYDWSRVFPQLGSKSIGEKKEGEIYSGTVSQGLKGLEQLDIDELKRGIRKIAETADVMSTMNSCVPVFTQKIGQISETFEMLQTRTEQVSQLMENSVKELSSGCHEINHLMSDMAKNLTEELKINYGKIITESVQLTGQFTVLENVVGQQVQHVKLNSDAYSKTMEEINHSLSVLNDLYKVQIQENKSTMETFQSVNGDLDEVCRQISSSAENTKQFKDESKLLSERVSALNSAYANMLSLVDNN